MIVTENISNTVTFFQTLFTLVFALSIGEAFKQFIADKAEKPEDRIIHWDRLPALITFMFLALPFFHGMVRYFFLVYKNAQELPFNYGVFLAFDGAAFIVMAALFFAMSRTLSAAQWRRYFKFIIALLFVDSTWIIVAVGMRGFDIALWLVLNAILIAVLIVLLVRNESSKILTSIAPWACASTAICTTAISYFFKWEVFFPKS